MFFAEGSRDNFKNDVVLLIAPMIIVKYFRKNVFKNKLTRVIYRTHWFLYCLEKITCISIQYTVPMHVYENK